MKYDHAGLGGTFDRLHLGHHQLLQTAFSTAKHVSIGITDNSFIKDKVLSQLILPYQKRFKELKQYLKQNNLLERATLFPLTDVYGPTLTDRTIDCLIVTSHTKNGAIRINQERRNQSLPELPIIQAKLVKDDSGQYISSTRIRQGTINRQGKVYAHLLSQNLTLSIKQKNQVKEPYGHTITLSQLQQIVNSLSVEMYVVGDQTLHTFINQNLPFTLGIFDGHIQRMPSDIVIKALKSHPIQPKIKSVSNPAGTINHQAVKAITMSQNKYISVTGEEDLLVIPLILTKPLDSLIFYGQPNQGMVMIKITETLKENIGHLLTLDQ